MGESTIDHQHIDDQWVEKARLNPKYFEVLYEKYFDQIYIFIYKRTFNEALSGDLCSNVFYKAFCGIKTYKSQGFPFSSWLYKIASNEINAYFRNQTNACRHIHIETISIQFILDEYDIEKELVLQKIEEIIPTLKNDEIQILELRFFENKSFKEIGYILNISADLAKIKTYRTIHKFKKIFNVV